MLDQSIVVHLVFRPSSVLSSNLKKSYCRSTIFSIELHVLEHMFHFVLGSYHVRSVHVSCLAIDLTGSDIGLKFIGLYALNVSHLQMGSSKICSK
jgi:hypothetical protein